MGTAKTHFCVFWFKPLKW